MKEARQKGHPEWSHLYTWNPPTLWKWGKVLASVVASRMEKDTFTQLGQCHFACGCPAFSAPFTQVHSLVLHSAPVISVCVLMTTPACFGHYSWPKFTGPSERWPGIVDWILMWKPLWFPQLCVTWWFPGAAHLLWKKHTVVPHGKCGEGVTAGSLSAERVSVLPWEVFWNFEIIVK